ncbi:MAG: hypothetical protein KA714_23120 [Limnoraphis sp. WC205]|nr:hypothetical protein [Limnoraphis sp. WC205]
MSQQRLLSNDDKHHSLQQKALDYLEYRGITPEMAERYNIGLNFGFRTPDGRSLPGSITLEDIQAAEVGAKQQQRWAEIVAVVVCDCLNLARTHHFEGSQHNAHWSKRDRRLTLLENDTEQKVLDVVWDDGWVNVDSQLDRDKVDYFLEEIQPRLQGKNSSPFLKKEAILR